MYGDTIHRNDGRNLHGGAEDDAEWQRRYDRVVAHPHRLELPPRTAEGKRFVRSLAAEWRGVQEGRWNSELPLIFAA